MRMKLILGALSVTSLGFSSLAASSPLVRSIGGDATPASITGVRDQFRADLGGDGISEINWDGVPDSFSVPNNLPANFFNGVKLSTPGAGFQVSANSGVAPVEFDNTNPTYSSTFGVFSSQRLFTGVGSNIVDVSFGEPGSRGLVGGFGAVFTDVDLTNSTTMEYFDAANNSLGVFAVPVGIVGSESLSFLGVSFGFGRTLISHVRITSGNTALGAGVNDGTPLGTGNVADLVAMDDFIYTGIVPEPETYAMLLAGLGLIGAISRRRKLS